MVELDLAVTSDGGKAPTEAPETGKDLTPMQQMDIALKDCKFGLFHLRLLFTALVGYVATVLVSNSSAYLLPAAECDLDMGLVHKGILNGMPYCGMMISCVVAGFLTDTFGRKMFLMIGYGGDFLFTLLSASSQTYKVLITGKFFEGFFFAMARSPTMSFTSEFCHTGIRDRMMLCQSSFGAMAQIIIAIMSWQILIRDWRLTLFDGYLVFHNWNFYLFACSLWSLWATILYGILPETPKYLLTRKKYKEARDVLTLMYTTNTGKSADTFPHRNLWKNQADLETSYTAEHPEQKSIKYQIVQGLHNMKQLYRRPLFSHLVHICCMIFFCMSMYNVIRMWFPQLSTIIEHSERGYNNVSQDLCERLDAYTAGLRETALNSTDGAVNTCSGKVSGIETYVNVIILGLVCLVPYLVSGVLVNRVGKKCLLFCAGLLTVAVVLGLRHASSKPVIVALFSTFAAISQLMIGLLQATLIELFPTSVRTLAISILMMVGRIGTLISNVAFPILLDMGCVIPFYSMAAIMCVLTALAVFLPVKKT